MAKTDRRIYAVTPHTKDAKPRLVEAPNAAQALRHVAADSFDVHIPTPVEMHKLSRMGIEIEQSGDAALREAAAADQQALPTS